MPVVVYPKKYLNELRDEIDEVKSKIASGEQPVFDSETLCLTNWRKIMAYQGTSDLFERSVNMNIRIIWYYEGDKMIILLDVGHHDILKQF